MMRKAIFTMAMLSAACIPLRAAASVCDFPATDTICCDSMEMLPYEPKGSIKKKNASPYELPYSFKGNSYDWHRLTVNTSVLVGAFVGALVVLEFLPEDATSWNRAELQDVPLHKRWHEHVIEKGPEWDHDKFYFNYILHPYAGAAYFMAARSCGFNFWKSAFYCSLISNVGWEYGIEAFMERPSIQDMLITPIVGSCIGEGFYRMKRNLISNGYKLFNSSFWGGVAAFFLDPVNEFTGIFMGNPARKLARQSTKQKKGEGMSIVPIISSHYRGVSLINIF